MVGVDHNDVALLFQQFPRETDLSTNPDVWRWVSTQSPERARLYSTLLRNGVRNAPGWDFQCPLCNLEATWSTKLGDVGVHAILAGIGCGEVSKTSCVCPKCKVNLDLTLHSNMKAKVVATIPEDLMTLLQSRCKSLQVDAVLLKEEHYATFRERFPNVKVAGTNYPPVELSLS